MTPSSLNLFEFIQLKINLLDGVLTNSFTIYLQFMQISQVNLNISRDSQREVNSCDRIEWIANKGPVPLWQSEVEAEITRNEHFTKNCLNKF